MALLLGTELWDFEPSEYHLWLLVDASDALRVVAVETVEWVEAALDVVLQDALEDLVNILCVVLGDFGGLLENFLTAKVRRKRKVNEYELVRCL